MNADLTRDTYRDAAHFRTVVFHQGRVPLDAELNESQDILAGHLELQARDLIGPAGGPQDNAGFGLTVAPDGQLLVGAGHYYVDGLLARAEAEVPLVAQPDLPGYTLPQPVGLYLAYLDVWIEHLTSLEDPLLREVALLGVETATRQRLVAQVRLALLDPNPQAAVECADPRPEWDALTALPTGRLAARAEPQQPPPNACTLTPGAGYRRLENQLYRVEIHQPGTRATARFKWSRDNNAIAAAWTAQNGNDITIARQPRDPLQTFAPGQWVELTDRVAVLSGNPGTLVRILNVDGNTLTLDPASATGPTARAGFPDHPVVRRWDGAGLLGLETGANADGFLPLEDGVEVRFSPGTYHRGDHWLIPARTVTGDVEWPRDPVTHLPLLRPRHGTRHHYARLALLAHTAAGWQVVRDCRRIFPPLGAGRCCCSVSVGDGLRSHGDFDNLESAVASLPPSGGTVCLLPGEHRVAARFQGLRNVTFQGCGPNTRLVPRPARTHAVLLAFRNCSQLTVRDLAFDDPEGTGLLAEADTWSAARGLVVERCEFIAGRSGLVVERLEQVRLERCLVDLTRARRTPGAAISLRAADALLRDNLLLGGTVGWGGLHLRAGSRHVTVLLNQIEGGTGHGITLGGNLDALDRLVAGLPHAHAPADGTATDDFVASFAPKSVTLRQPQALFAVTDREGKALPDVPVSLTAPDRSELILADDRGELLARLDPGTVHVSLGDGLRLAQVNHRRASSGLDVVRLVAEPARIQRRAASDLDSFLLAARPGDGDAPAARRDTPYRELDESLPLSEIHVEDNCIRGCGLSGIGILPHPDTSKSAADRYTEIAKPGGLSKSQLSDRLAALLPDHETLFRTPIRDLTLAGNRLANTFQGPLVPALLPKQYGYGGITLGSVSRARIVGNRITAFGQAFEKPACGIFLMHAEGLEIAENQIRSDSPRAKRLRLRGFSGGIVCRFALDHQPSPARAQGKAKAKPGTATTRDVSEAPALVTVRDNVVSVPSGRALSIAAFGSLRCHDNVFETNLPGFNPLDLLVGNTLILNLGGFLDYLRVRALGKPTPTPTPTPGSPPATTVPAPSKNLGRSSLMANGVFRVAYNQPRRRLVATEGFLTRVPGDGTSTGPTDANANDNATTAGPGLDLPFDLDGAGVGSAGLLAALFGAGTAFHRNHLVSGPHAKALANQLIVTFGDLRYADNHATCHQLRGLPVNAALVGTSLRASGNRLSEAHDTPGFSLLGFAFGPNATTHNQFDHCFLAATAGFGGLTPITSPNQVLFPQFCAKLLGDPTGSLAALASGQLARLDDTEDALPGFDPRTTERDITHSLADGESLVRDGMLAALHQGLAASVAARDIETRAVEAVFGPDLDSDPDHTRDPIHPETRRASDQVPLLNAVRSGHQILAGLDAAAPVPPPNAAIIEGRLLFEDGRGIAGLIVQAETADGRVLPGQATSLAGGVFQLALDPKVLPESGARRPVPLTLAVLDATGRLLHRSTSPVPAAAGTHTTCELPLPRAAFLGRPEKATPRTPPKSSAA